VVKRGGVGAQRLLLGDLRPGTQPSEPAACPSEQFRQLAIGGQVDARLNELIRKVCAERDAVKARSSPVLRDGLPRPRSRLPTLWTNSHFAATVDGATSEIVKRYVENQQNAQSTPLPPQAEARGFSGAY
jgi:hypothetical protein